MRSIFLVQCLVFLLPLVALTEAPPKTDTNNTPVDDECSLNGVLNTQGSCVCLRGWNGANCSLLSFGAASPSAGLQLSGNSTWGGAAVFDDKNNKWHLFASLIKNSCGLNSWLPNSMVMRAEPVDESVAPDGAWTFAEVLEGNFAHSPEARRNNTGDGSITIPFIYESGLPTCENCSAGRTGTGVGCNGWTPGTKFFGDWGPFMGLHPWGHGQKHVEVPVWHHLQELFLAALKMVMI